MINFDILNSILAFDFSQMRKKINLRGDAGATDEALLSFLNLFSDFYSQCTSKPNKEELAEYERLMQLITECINTSEVNYYTEKYIAAGETPEMAAEMACLQALQNFNGIPIRMQYWAAGEKWGDSIRNPELHSPLIKQMKIWSSWCNPTSPTTYFFDTEAEHPAEAAQASRKLSF